MSNYNVKKELIKQEVMRMDQILSMQKDSFSKITLMFGDLFKEIKWIENDDRHEKLLEFYILEIVKEIRDSLVKIPLSEIDISYYAKQIMQKIKKVQEKK